MRLLLLSALLILSGLFHSTNAQSSETGEVQQTIDRLFEGMIKSDSSIVASKFKSDAIMQTIRNHQDGSVSVANGDLSQFLSNIHRAEPGVLNEKLNGYEIKVDGKLASAWTPYEFYVGEEFSHCGVNSFQLLKTSDGWKIFHIVDTRRSDNCVQ